MVLVRGMEINGFLDRVNRADVLVDVRTVTIVTTVTVVHYCEVAPSFPPWIPSLVA
jgi:hypothetical protein